MELSDGRLSRCVSYLQPQDTVGNHAFQKSKEQDPLTSSSVRGSLMYLSAR